MNSEYERASVGLMTAVPAIIDDGSVAARGPSSDGSDITQMVAAIQHQMNNIQSMMQSPQAQPQTPLPGPGKSPGQG